MRCRASAPDNVIIAKLQQMPEARHMKTQSHAVPMCMRRRIHACHMRRRIHVGGKAHEDTEPRRAYVYV